MLTLFVMLLCAGYICYGDITQRIISNKLVLIVLVTSLLSSGLSAFAVIPMLLATLAGLLLFAIGAFAGGDIKLMLAFLPGIALQWWPVVFLLIAIIGGVMAVGYLGYGLWTKRLRAVRERGLPYGVPIAIAGFLGVLLTSTG